MSEFLLEIGFEEMPAPWLSDLAAQLQAKFEGIARDAQLNPSLTRVLWTSRRLVLVSDVRARQEDRTVVEFGPAAKIAKDASGVWSKAAEGFARKQGVALDALTLAPKVAGSADLFVSVAKQVAGRASGAVLAESLAPLLRGLNFPKRMNWDAWLDDGRGAFEFGRPIQWIVALLDGEVVPFEIFDAVNGARGAVRLRSACRSMGNRFYPRDSQDRGFDVRSFAELDAGLSARFVILDPARRAERITSQLAAAGGRADGPASHLVSEWNDLVEYPTLAIGEVPKEFADLPGEVMETVLAHHQKAVMLPPGEGGEPRFAAISGCDDAGARNAAQGQERVVIARLKDARFFWDEDRKRTLESRVEDLASVTFQKGLGSYAEKTRRMVNVATSAAGQAPERPAWTDAARALRLSKADLTTLMVREFPELQGTMGGLYARDTESPAVANAIAGQYSTAPTLEHAGERAVANATSLIDKLDTLVGYFRIGTTPSGSADPYGLRRAGLGVIRILLDQKATILQPGVVSLATMLNNQYESQGTKLVEPPIPRLNEFLTDRLRHALRERGHAASAVEAVLAAQARLGSKSGKNEALDNPPRVEGLVATVAALHSEQPDVFAALAESFKRAKNIVGDATAAVVDENLFAEDAERKLFAAIQNAEKTPSSDPAVRLRAVAALRDHVDAFFKTVMVNAEDPTIRANRHAILQRLLDLVYEIADLSRLTAPAASTAA